MGYKVLYDNQLLFDPYTDDRITDTKLSSKLNAASYFDFTIAPTHSLYSKLAERAGEVRIYFDNLILFKGEITKIEEDFEGNYSVSCTGVLDYLTATRVRPYSTVEGEQPLKAPSSYDGYFQWLIDHHNSNCLDSRKHFSVGVNQGNMLDKNNYIYRSSEQRPTTASEIEDKILNSAGGYLFVRYQDDLNILDLYADVHDVNTQIIDYGVNMLDFTKTTTAEGQYTAVVATGYTPDPPEGQTDVKMKPITLEGCTDGGTPYSSTIVKMGDRVYDVEAVARYGYHEYYVSNTDITTYDGLLYYACKTLNTLLSPALTISVKAVDLALIMGDKYKHLQLGQAVRIRSKPRKVDEYLMVNSIDLDLMNPENTTFDLGASYDTLTGQQSAYLKALNSSINSSLDTVASLGDNVKNSAKLAQEASTKAEAATNAATDASAKADAVTDIANSAVEKADSAASKAEKAITESTTATSKAEEAINNSVTATAKAEEAINNSTTATAKAEEAINNSTTATAKAEEAINNSTTATSKAEEAKNAADSAQKTANDASTSAGNANKVATEAKSSADEASEAASNATAKAEEAKTEASNASAAASTAKDTADSVKNDLATNYTTTVDTQTKLDSLSDRIMTSVESTYVTNDDMINYAQKSELTQVSDSLTARIATTQKTVDGISKTTKNVEDYMKFESGPKLTIGTSASAFKTVITNTGEQFTNAGQTVMELDGTTSTVKANRIKTGKYQWQQSSDGNAIQLIYLG
jgi:hypothetical protein